jgi:hypothetical protein
MHLEENMHVHTANTERTAEERQAAQQFSKWLLSLGNGTIPHIIPDSDTIQLPTNMCMPEGTNINALIEWVFPNLATRSQSEDSHMLFSERAIITPLTSNVHHINDTIINDILPYDANEWECLSADQVTDSHQALSISVEFLNTIQISGLPTHKLQLRKHMPIMVLRNLSIGICNG